MLLLGIPVLAVFPWFAWRSRHATWRELGERYETNDRPERWDTVDCVVDATPYRTRVACDPQGLFLSPVFPHNLGLPTLFVSWSGIEAVDHQQGGRVTVLTLKDAEIPLRLPSAVLAPAQARLQGLKVTSF